MSSLTKIAAKLPPVKKAPKRTVRVEGIFDETVILKLDVNSVAEIEDKIGANITSLFGKTRIGFGTLRYLYWGALIWKNPLLEVNTVGAALTKAMETKSYQQLMEPIAQVLAASGLFSSNVQDVKETPEDEDEDGEISGVPLDGTSTEGTEPESEPQE